MPRRALSRQQQAFQALLEPDDIEESDQRRGSQGKGKASSARKFKSMDTKTPGFKLHEAQNESSPGPSGSGGSDLAHLQELFGQTLAHEVIQDVYEACGGSSEATVEALLSMSGGEPAPIRDSEKAEQPSPLATQPANAASHGRDPEQPCFWDLLPEECKLLILDHLSLKELARAAGTCRELAQHVCAQRRSITRIMVPPRLSAVALRGLVAAYIAATEVDLSRCSQSLRFSNEFEDTFKAIAEGAADRQSGVLVHAISLAKCAALTDGDVAALCSTLHTLRVLDLSRCPLITDAALAALARYRCEAGVPSGPGMPSAAQTLEQQMEEMNLDQHGSSSGVSALESPRSAVARIAAAKEAAAAARVGSPPLTMLHAAGGIAHLTLGGTSVTTRGVSDLLKGSSKAPYLSTLDVSRCAKVSGDALDPGARSTLSRLCANSCSSVRSVVLQLPATSALVDASLADCRCLQEAIISAPALEDLNISGCAQLSTLALRCPRLLRLRASGCASLVLGANGALFECPKLRAANFFGCRELDSSGFEAALPSFCALEHLDLTGCTALGRVVATEGAGLGRLRRIVVDGCAVLRHLALNAPELQEVSAKSCSRLMEVTLLGSAPKALNFENCRELREVAVAGGGSALGSAAATMPAHATEEQGSKDSKAARKALVLTGCVLLPPAVRTRLEAVVSGS